MADASDGTDDPGGVFDQALGESLASARVLLAAVFDATTTSVIGIGRDAAPWLQAATELGANRVVGVDDVPSDGVRADARFDLVLSLVVAEQLSPTRAPGFVAAMCGLGDLVLFSAAAPGSGKSTGERWPDYWSGLFREHGFVCFDAVQPVGPGRTMLVFAKRGTSAIGVADTLTHRQPALPSSWTHPGLTPQTEAGERIVRELARHYPFDRGEAVRVLEAKVDRLRAMVAETEAATWRLRIGAWLRRSK